MERRRALKKLTTAAALLAAAAAPYGFSALLSPKRPQTRNKAPNKAHRRNYLRPPGALKDDAAFVAACIGCGLCGEVCPPRCILFHSRGGGIKVNTPYIEPQDKACILCNKCMQACPTEALVMTALEKIDMGLARIDRTACYPWVDRGICGACVSICPLGARAIKFKMWNQYRPVILGGCVGCGLCVEVCPHPSVPIWVIDRTSESRAERKV